MGLLGKLFGGKPKPEIDHPRFGMMRMLRASADQSAWAGRCTIGAADLEIFLQGNELGPVEGSLTTLEQIVSEPTLLNAARESVIETLRNREPQYPSERFDTDMELVAIDIKGRGSLTITYQQRQDPFYHFNAEFEDGRTVGVSIDS